MFQPRRTPRLKGLPFNQMIPNILTLGALIAGMSAIRFGFQGRFEQAVIAVLIAAILDGLDGRVARLLRGTSKFGAELDSLSDFLSFGVAPAMVLYVWKLKALGGLGWAVCLLLAVGGALRLARFNTMLGNPDMPPWGYNFFTGVPTPAGAMIALLPMMLTFGFGQGFFDIPLVAAVMVVASALLMVSRVPTFSGKKFKVPHTYVLPLMLVIGMLAAFLVTALWPTMSVIVILYLVSIPFSVRRFRILSGEAARMQGHAPGDEAAPPPSP